jgi:hypothetical protein
MVIRNYLNILSKNKNGAEQRVIKHAGFKGSASVSARNEFQSK